MRNESKMLNETEIFPPKDTNQLYYNSAHWHGDDDDSDDDYTRFTLLHRVKAKRKQTISALPAIRMFHVLVYYLVVTLLPSRSPNNGMR